jgi:hypothetical protein
LGTESVLGHLGAEPCPAPNRFVYGLVGFDRRAITP